VLTLGLSSCGNSLQSKQLFPQAQPITAVATEALALTQAIRSGLRVQSAQTLELNHLYTQDILGNPYGDIIFSTPETVPNALEYAVGIKDQDWSNVDDPTYQTVVMGASTARSILLYRANHQRLIGNIGKTIQALGGVGQVQKLVSVNGVDSIWILDKQNAYWSIANHQPVTASQVSEAISSTTKTTDEINAKSELVEVFKKQWSVILEGHTTSPGLGGQKVSDKLDPLKGKNPLAYFDNGKGHLNKKLFLEMGQLGGAFSTTNIQPQFNFVAGAAIGSAFGPAGALVGATFGWTADVFIKIGLYTRMGQLIVQDVGQREIPLIAVYNVSGGGFDFNGLHYSPIREYSITNWLVWPDVQVKTVDTNEFRALSDISLPASGLMGAYQPSKEYAPSLWPGLISWR
jgi:hypothetical protein